MPTAGRFDRVVDALGHKYRRRLLVALTAHNPQDDEDAQGAEEALWMVADGDEQPDMLQTELIHTHLPKLEAEGYIDWNEETGDIERGPNWEEIAPLLALLQDHEDELPDDWL